MAQEKRSPSFLVTLLGLAIFFGAIYFIMRYSPEKSLSTKKKQKQVEELTEKVTSSLEELFDGQCAVCLDVDAEKKLPLLPKESFSRNVDMLYCYSKLDNPAEIASVTHYWFFKGQLIGEKRLPLPKKSPYAVWSRMDMPEHPAGKWHVDVLAGNGRKICTTHFRLE